MRIHLGSKEGWTKGKRDVGVIQIPFFKLILASICPRFRTFDWIILMREEEIKALKFTERGEVTVDSLSMIVPIEGQSKKYIITKAKRLKLRK